MKATINAIIERWSKDTETKFGVVAYTDHGPMNAHYPA